MSPQIYYNENKIHSSFEVLGRTRRKEYLKEIRGRENRAPVLSPPLSLRSCRRKSAGSRSPACPSPFYLRPADRLAKPRSALSHPEMLRPTPCHSAAPHSAGRHLSPCHSEDTHSVARSGY